MKAIFRGDQIFSKLDRFHLRKRTVPEEGGSFFRTSEGRKEGRMGVRKRKDFSILQGWKKSQPKEVIELGDYVQIRAVQSNEI
jgi:hypothetical protein